jgi:Ca-activated chloride channel family protein
MKQCFAIRNLVIAGTVSLASGLLGGFQQADRSDFTIRSDVRLVLLDVSVKDRDGGFVSGLSKDNFSVFENGRPHPITVFANGDLPVTVGILVDESFSMSRKRDEVLTAAQTFIEESNPQDEIFVLNFNDRVTRGLPGQMLFSGDIQQLRAALYRGVPQGKTALNDAIVAGLKQLELGKRDKKALIVISDGGDNASEHKRADMLNLVEKSIATIYTIGLYDADDPDRSPGILKELAKISGGEAFFPKDPPEMIPICRRIAKDIRARYTIGYVPEAQNGAGPVRHIQVRVSAPGRARLIAHTRTSYRYEEATHQQKK